MLALRADPERPVYVIHDDGDTNDVNRIATFNIVAKGETQAPGGNYVPSADRYYPRFIPPSEDPNHLPFTESARHLSSGVNRFSFTGQYGVDCDVFVAAKSADATLGHWSVEIQSATIPDGDQHKMHQQILRVRTADPLYTIIIPRRANDTSVTATIEQQGDEIVIKLGATTYRVQPTQYTIDNNGVTVVRNVVP